MLQQTSYFPALFIIFQQVPHTRLLTALAFVLNLHASLPGLPPAAGHEKVSPSPCCHSTSELPRSPRWKTLPPLSVSTSAGPVHPVLPEAAPRAPALPASRSFPARDFPFPPRERPVFPLPHSDQIRPP